LEDPRFESDILPGFPHSLSPHTCWYTLYLKMWP